MAGSLAILRVISSVGRASRLHRESQRFKSVIAYVLRFFRTWGSSSDWLECWPVTPEAAGSNPVFPV